MKLQYKMLLLTLSVILAMVAATSSTEGEQCCDAPSVQISSRDPRPKNMAFIIGSQKSGEHRRLTEGMAGRVAGRECQLKNTMRNRNDVSF